MASSDNYWGLPRAPVFEPSATEFLDPMAWMEKVYGTVEKFGICKLIPPPEWDFESFWGRMGDWCNLKPFKTKLQSLNRLLVRNGPQVVFTEQLKAFWDDVAKIPLSDGANVVDGEVVDYYELYVGMKCAEAFDSNEPQWENVLDFLKLSRDTKNKVQKVYLNVLLPFLEWLEEKGVDVYEVDRYVLEKSENWQDVVNGKNWRRGLENANGMDERVVEDGRDDVVVDCGPDVDLGRGNPLKKKLYPISDQNLKVKMSPGKWRSFRMESFYPRYDDGDANGSLELAKKCATICSVCGNGDRSETLLICDNSECLLGTHLECLGEHLRGVPRGKWFCSNCSKQASDDEEDDTVSAFGCCREGKTFYFDEFVDCAIKMSDKWIGSACESKRPLRRVSSGGCRSECVAVLDPSQIEQIYWSIIKGADKFANVFYGSDLDVSKYSSGFPLDPAWSNCPEAPRWVKEEARIRRLKKKSHKCRHYFDSLEAHFDRLALRNSNRGEDLHYRRRMRSVGRAGAPGVGNGIGDGISGIGDGEPSGASGKAREGIPVEKRSKYADGVEKRHGKLMSRSGWNPNNLPYASLLRYLGEKVAGVTRPMLYMGMLFSSFCWHTEDNWLYSVNYVHAGAPKMWYGIPSLAADDFEALMRRLYPSNPQVIYQLTTQVPPDFLRSCGIPVYQMVQHAGEFIVTLPRAYHAGFNLGANVAESVNFATPSWLSWGLRATNSYRFLRSAAFSHERLLFNILKEMRRRDGNGDKFPTQMKSILPAALEQWKTILRHDLELLKKLTADSCIVMVIPNEKSQTIELHPRPASKGRPRGLRHIPIMNHSMYAKFKMEKYKISGDALDSIPCPLYYNFYTSNECPQCHHCGYDCFLYAFYDPSLPLSDPFLCLEHALPYDSNSTSSPPRTIFCRASTKLLEKYASQHA